MRCTQPGCAGEIVDGYCDSCGMAPVRPATANAPIPPLSAPSTMDDAGSMTLAASASASGPSGPGATTSGRRGPRRIGHGLVELPALPVLDPADAVLANPAVPESRRFCARCDEPVGRGRDGAPGRTSGFCRQCGAAFSFEPKLAAHDMVAGQYEVVGCLAHGGMGWVYLARDRNVSDRWVVLKGILNAGDSDATAAALAERRFLAEVEHPNIVKIFNFVEHDGAGYIVMEYVGGQSLKQVLVSRREATGRPDPLPAAEAIADMLEILPAIGHLHDLGLLFCDFKVDNVIQTRHSLKLIDLGGVIRVDEPSAAIFGTVGYQAPEIATAGPSVASDLFTVARTLAVLLFDFRAYQSTYRFTLPPADSVPVLRRYESLYRWLQKGTAADPRDRFASAEEMAGQLHGVLCEVVADVEDRPVPSTSSVFTGALRARPERADWHVLPRPQASREDVSAGYLAALTTTDARALVSQLRVAPERTRAVELRLAAALIEAEEFDEARVLLERIQGLDPRDWQARWYLGVLALATGRADAVHHFDAVLDAVPGELAPKLALGVALELAGRTEEAARWYRTVSQTDPSITSASFGLARCRLQAGDRAAAVACLERVPDTSSGHLDAQVTRVRYLTSAEPAPGASELAAAHACLQTLDVDDEQRERLTVEVLRAGLRAVTHADHPIGVGVRLGDVPLAERDLRVGIERTLRSLARRAPTRDERIELVDEANRTRPRTWT